MSAWRGGYDEEIFDAFDRSDKGFIECSGYTSRNEAFGDFEVFLLSLFYHI